MNCDLALKRKSQIFSIIISLLGNLGFELPAKSLFSSNFIHESILRKAKSHLFSAEAPLFRNFSLFSKVPLNYYYYWKN